MATLTTLPNGHLALPSDDVTAIALVALDASGGQVPMPASNVSTVVTTGTFAASLGAAIGVMPGTTNAAVILTPLVLESDAGNSGGGIGLTITDTAGLPITTGTTAALFDIVVDATPAAEGLDLTNVVSTPQTAPVAPGP
jgi:hypothetical protein